MNNKDILKFLQESNAIEGVYDADSLFQAFVAWEYLMKEKKLSIGAILKVHKILMLHQESLYEKDKGYFRNCDVRVGSRACSSHLKVHELMEKWIKSYAPITVDAKKAHIAFEKIHPFVDGNGRTGRLLLLWQYVKLELPIKIIYEKDRQEYYKWFH